MDRLSLLAALLVPTLLAGCNSPVGTYRVDTSALLESSCGGIDAQRIQAWQAALDAAPATDLQIGSKAGVVQAQLQRDDGTILFADVGDNGERYVGTRFVEGTTTSEAILGSDFSGLLEVSGVCTFDLTVDVDLNFGSDGNFDSVVAEFTATVEETDAAEACDIQQCRAVIRAGAGQTSTVNPGIQE